MRQKLLHFALLLHFVSKVITFCVTITFCVSYYILWRNNWYGNQSETKLHLSNLDVLYGVFHSSRYCLALNHLIIIGKYYLYINSNARNKVQFGEYKSLVRDKLVLERYIASKSGTQAKYIKKWDFLQNI